MNYYERHLGDYSKNASHLSLLEHGIYVRLIDVYYTKEAPIPADKAARWIGAATEPETQALQEVLQEFFELRDGCWHQSRCDEEIERYLAGEPERAAKKANEDTRLKRHREERAALFRTLSAAGRHAPWDTKMDTLRKLAAECVAGVAGLDTGNAPATPTATPPATATATPATATQQPVATTHTPSEELADSSLFIEPLPTPPPPAFDGKNAEILNGKAVVELSRQWELPESWGVDAEALGWQPREVLLEAEKFRQYWTAGKGEGTRRAVKGWRQTWSNWLGKAAERKIR